MLNIATATKSSLNTPFQTNAFLVKSAWKNCFFERKQVRVLVGSAGELSVQTVAQNILARIVSKILSTLSGGRIKSFGKTVQSQVSQVYLLPSDLAVPLNTEQQKKIFDLQCNLLVRTFLPSFQKLNDLIPSLEEYVINESADEEIMKKFISMRGDILGLQTFLQKEFLRDIQPHELHELYQTFEKQAKEMCEQYPEQLKQFIEAKKEKALEALLNQQPKPESVIALPVVEEASPHTDDIPAVPAEEIKQPVMEAPKPATPKEQLTNLMTYTNGYIETLERNLQFSSAQWLKQELDSIVNTLSESGEYPFSIKEAIESLEDALDYIPENISMVNQLMVLPPDSPYEQKLKDAVIADIKQTVAVFLKDLKAKQHEAAELIKNSPSSSWHETLNQFFDSKKSYLETLATHHTPVSFFSSLTDNERISIESLNKSQLAEHKNHIDTYCASVLEDLEKETNLTQIQKQRLRYEEWKALIPVYHPVLIENAQYYPLALLENLVNKQTEILANASSALIDAKSTMNYKDKLKDAADQLETLFKDIEKYQNMNSIDQLESLQELSSPYYNDLHTYIVDKAKEQLNSYKTVLGNYADMLTIYIPVFKEKGNPIVADLEALETKVHSKISEAEALAVSYVVRPHFWNYSPVAMDLKTLSPNHLNNYLIAIKELINTGMQEIVQDAAKLGMN